MNARNSAVSASIVDLSLHIETDSENDRVRYQIRDAQAEAVFEEGTVTSVAKSATELKIPLPAEEGAYVVLVAADSDGDFMSDAGKPLLSFAVSVDDAVATLVGYSTTTRGTLRRQGFFRSVGRATVYPFRSIWANRSLIRSMVRRDIAGRYAGSHAGVFWTLIHPLLMMLTYAFVFGLVLQTRFANDSRPTSFVLYFLAGMLPWLPFSEAIARAPTVVIEHSNFVKKLVFPLDILPINVVFAGLISQFFGIGIFFIALMAFGREIHATAFYLPLLLVPQVLLTLGLSWLLAGLGVLFRDLGQLIGFVVTVWFFVTPICYDAAQLPQQYLWLFEKNPFYVLVGAYRAVLLENAAPAWGPFMWLCGGSVAMFLLGYAWFYRMRRQFADLV
jgi:lipopolysaccharide transport system permease protein